MASMNTRLNIKKIDGNIVQKHEGSKQVGFKQLGLGVETGVHGVHDEKRVWFEVELQGAQGDREAEFFQVSNIDTAVAQRRLEDKQPEEKTNTDYLRSTQQCTKSGVAKHLGVAGLQQQNGLVKETNVTLLAKVRCFLIQSGLSKVLWAEDTTMSTYLVNKVVLYRNMGFNESGEYKKTFIGSGVGTGSMQENVDQGAGLQEVQTQDLMDYQLARDREQHLACELFGYREDSNEAAFAVAAVEKIYAHESLTFNDTVACEVISKWKAGLKDDMDARSDVYVLSNGCKKCSDDSDGYYWESTPAAYMTLTDAAKEAILLKRLTIESGFELKIVAGIATSALSKAIPSLRQFLGKLERSTLIFPLASGKATAISLSDEEIALDASSEGTMSPGGPRYDYMLSSEAEDDY
ncbi:hypothetical protein Tco_0952025 [Tanacetum coccineum]|uniref:Zinc finger, CCHC-type n=1 Tax=Tanacetum coccineum TaxID=301880 RepID=A0ABQ5DVV3_9ASTR